MYIERITSQQSGRTYHRYVLRNSYRQDGKVRHKNIYTFPASTSEEEIAALRQALKTKAPTPVPVPTVGLDPHDIIVTQGPRVGGVLALLELARRLGLSQALGNSRPARLALWLILVRLLAPGSRLGAVRAAQPRGAADLLELSAFTEEHLYAALDWLAESQEKMEQKLFRKRHGATPPTLFLYDVTSSYLEGDKNELGTWGYNRDKKEGKKQIVIGLLTDGAGDPVAVRVFEGNTSDPQTVEEQVRTLTQSFGVHEVTLVGDRGMLKSPQIDKLPEGFRYITAITKPQIRGLLADGVLQLSLFDEQVCEIEHAVESGTADGESESESESKRDGKPTVVRYILKRNPKRAVELAASRQARLDRLRAFVEERNAYLCAHGKAGLQTALKAAQDKARQLNLHGFTGLEVRQRVLSVSVDEAAREEQAQLDGCYALKTDLPQTTADAETVHARYKDLKLVEWAFRTFKGDGLDIRPLFLRNQQRTRGHVFAVMLAYLIERELAQAWRSLDCTVPEGVDALDALAAVELSSDGAPILRLPKPQGLCAHLLDALNLTLPEVLPAQKVHVAPRKFLAENRKA